MELQQDNEAEVLMLLNSNSETPYFLWNNSCRAELEELLQRNSKTFREAAFGAADLPSLSTSLAGFTYSLHASEVVVGGVFLRLFIAQPNYPIQSPVDFFTALLVFLLDRVANVTNKEGGAGSAAGAPTSLSNEGSLREAPLLAARSLRLLSGAYTEALSATVSKQMRSLVTLLTPSLAVAKADIPVARDEESMRSSLFLDIVQALAKFLSSDACLQALSAVETAMTAVVLLLEQILGNYDKHTVRLLFHQMSRMRF
ncbi:hypothetical_protein [Leishmania braziliensis MHOM/BR/75/M2904]|uniref:Hypothetical_protein n=1 Tax=Leishmania braziliensis MHOM/BR/75/M2904 TaxID=420245 RepID=A0A3P3ZCT1_LEIBR|nr:hypothetical_protein [Leishmania braziliensis MHOM/BR/75/M2904]